MININSNNLRDVAQNINANINNLMSGCDDVSNSFTRIKGNSKSDEFIDVFEENMTSLVQDLDKMSSEQLTPIVAALNSIAEQFEQLTREMSK
jgi:methyl-accepting chemotaxis protein